MKPGRFTTVADNTSTNVRSLDQAAHLARSLKEKAVSSSGSAKDVLSSSRQMANISRNLSNSVNQFQTKRAEPYVKTSSEFHEWEQDAKKDGQKTELDDTGS